MDITAGPRFLIGVGRAGFADTVNDTVTVTSTNGSEVSVTLDAEQSN